MAYIPEAHKKYNLLPRCTENGGEVFSYPSELASKIGEMSPGHVIPYGYSSYDEFYTFLDDCISECGMIEGGLNELGKLIADYKICIQRMNIKENWSVLRYLGESSFDLTHGRYYYWPCSAESPEYEGVIDNAEFTSYLAAVTGNEPIHFETDTNGKTGHFSSDVCFSPYGEKVLWEIAEDPTGMAARFLNSNNPYDLQLD